MRRLMMLCVIISAVLSFSVPMAAQQDTTPQPISFLQVIDSEPQRGAELGLTDAVTLYFDRDLDCTTAQNALSVQPAMDGALTCEGAVLTFTPAAQFASATPYTFTLADSVRGADGSPLAEPFSLTLSSIGALTVTNTIPSANVADVVVDQRLTIIFNRPIVPLTTLGEADTFPVPISISPIITGQGEWLNTSVYLFTPDTTWAGGTTYTVTVEAGLAALDGAALNTPYTFTFTTIMPAVIETMPGVDANEALGLDTPIQFKFNQPIERASFENNFTLSVDGVADLPINGAFEWNDDSTGVKYTHGERFPLATPFIFGFSANRVFEASGKVALPAFEGRFITVGLPAIISTYPKEGDFAFPYDGIQIYYASRMNPETLNDKIIIEPTPNGDVDFFYRDWENALSVTFGAEPSTEYRVTIQPGSEDIYGNKIEQPFTFTYMTRPYDPSLSLIVPSGYVGFYDAGRIPTEMFLTHRNVSSVNIGLFQMNQSAFMQTLLAENQYGAFEALAASVDRPIRAWEIPNVAPVNVLRYERLNLSDFSGAASSSSGITCAGAPATRTKLGDIAVVTTDPDPLRARETPVDGNIVDLLYKGYQFEIVGGPQCANDLYWWQVKLREDKIAWVAEGITGEYFFEVTLPSQQTTIPLSPEFLDAESLPAGIYLLRATSPEIETYGPLGNAQFMVVGTANLTLKASIDEAVVWATDVRSGQPLVGVALTLYSGENGAPQIATTDAQGVARFELVRRENVYESVAVVLDDGVNFGIGWSEWADGIEPWWFSQTYNYYPQQYTFYLYTERSIYRPGDTVYYRGIVRQKDDMTYSVPAADFINVRITNYEGVDLFTGDLPLNDFGSFNGVFTLDKDASLGYYTIVASLPSDGTFDSENGNVSFDVAEYRVPEFEVTVTSDRDAVANGETITYEVDTRYFFGGAVANANVSYNVMANSAYFDYQGEGYYQFIDYDYDDNPYRTPFSSYYGDFVMDGSGVTDANGKLSIEIPAALKENYTQIYTLEASVLDETGFGVAGRTSVTVHPSEVYVGIKPADYVNSVGEESVLDIITVDWDSAPMSGQEVTVEVFERRWSSVQRLDQNTGRITYDTEVENIPVADGRVTTDADGKASFSFNPPVGGVYKALVTTTDAQGRTAKASTFLWVSSNEFIAWRVSNNNRIDLINDQQEYVVGDTAEILIQSPFSGTAEALVTVERGSVLSTERITINSSAYVHHIEITDEMAPNVFVSVFIVKGVDENNPVAQFRLGLSNLRVDTARKVLNIALAADKDFAQPGDTITYTVTTTNYAGDPVRAEVGVALTDLAVLSIGQDYTLPILESFYYEQGLGVRTSSALTVNTDLLTQYTLDVIKGGGGGGGGDVGIYEIREEFIDTPYWNAELVTNENGQATFSVTLPDNLTTWRLNARGITDSKNGQTLVGETDLDIIATQPLLVRPVAPRFFVVDDQVKLGAVVNNNTAEAVSAVLDINAVGVTFTNEDTAQRVEIAAGGSARVTWDVTVDDVSAVELVFMVNGNDGQYTDAARPRDAENGLIPVYKYEAPETVGTGGTLTEAGARVENIVIPRRLNVTQGELTVNLDSSLANVIFKTLDVLERERCECISLTASRLMSNAAAKRLLLNTPDAEPKLMAELDTQVNIAIQRIAARQNTDGGWGWYESDESDQIMSTYVVLALGEARAAGYAVDEFLLTMGSRYLARHIILGKPNETSFSALTAYALSKIDMPSASLVSALFEQRARFDVGTKALILLSLPANDPRIEVLRNEIFADVILSANGTHWESDLNDWVRWSSDTTSTALALKALLIADPDNELLPGAMRWLMIARQGDAWHTYHENAWVVSTIADWVLATDELNADYSYTVALNDGILDADVFTPASRNSGVTLVTDVSQLLTDAPNVLRFERTGGTGALYYTAYLRAFLSVPTIPPVDRGLSIARIYTYPGSDEPITQARVGEVVQARLTIIVPNEVNYIQVEDPLPAGAEGINPNLNTSQQGGTDPTLIEQGDDTLSYGWGWWYFRNIQFEDDRVVLSSTYLSPGTYEFIYTMRPSVEGVYNVIPPTASLNFFPEVFGRGAGSTFTVLPAAE